MGPQREPDIAYTQLFINNEWVDSVSGKTFLTFNPATADKVCEVQEGDAEDIDKAVEAAEGAFKLGSKWRTMDASTRGLLMHKLANLMERDIEHIASLDTISNGKVYKEALAEMHGAIKIYRYFAGWADKIHGKTIPADGASFTYTRLEPVGICGFILPWNFPMLLLAHKLGPALAAGCVLVIKPAEQTPLSTLYVAKLIKESGFPPGVFNVVPGFGETAGQAIASHMKIDKVSFTGSTEVGKLIQEAAGRSNSKRVTLETGGKSPLVVCADADLDYAVTVAHMACFYNQGQACCAGTRTFVHEDIYDDFVNKSREMALSRVIGNPFDDATIQGPQVDREQFQKIIGLMEKGKEEGATIECGGERDGDTGYFIKPTVFSDVTDEMSIARQEIFGPVQQILKFKTLDEVIERSNATEYGLAAGIVTNNLKTALMYIQGVRAGSMWVNTWYGNVPQTPFGGFKMSGFGRECGPEGLLPYLEVKTVVIKLPQKNT